MIQQPTSKEYKDKWYQDNSWNWRTSGIHAYNVLKREETELKNNKRKRNGRKR